MKAERRHELQHNQLADTLGEQIEQIKPYFKTILAVIIAMVAVGFTLAFLNSRQNAKNEAAWSGYYAAMATADAEEIEAFASAHEGTPAAQWALLKAGEMKLAEGSRAMFEDRKDAEVKLDQAKKHFLAVLDNAKSEPLLQRRAQFALAETYEAQNLPDDAEPLYEQIVKDEPEGPFGKLAAERLKQIERLNSEEWFTWFAAQKPQPAFDPRGTFPGGLDSLPDRDNLNKTGDLMPDILNDRYNIPKPSGDDIKLPGDDNKPDAKEPDEPDATKPDESVDPAKPDDPEPETPKPDDKPADSADVPETTEPKADEPKPEDAKPE